MDPANFLAIRLDTRQPSRYAPRPYRGGDQMVGRAIFGCAFLAGCSKELPSLDNVNQPPQVTLLSPEEDTQAQEGSGLTFVAAVSDNGHYGNLIVEWRSDLDGVLVEDGGVDADWHTQFTTGALSPGFHSVTVEITDSGDASAQDSVTVRIVDVADAPSLTVVRPGSGETGTEDVGFQFVVEAHDPQDPPQDLLVKLESDLDGYVCTLPIDGAGEGRCISVLSVGSHLLTFSATDPDGFTTEATTWFDVLPNLDVDDDNDGWTIAEGDCDDANASVHPTAVDVAYDGIDQDCFDGDLADVDGDGYDAAEAGGPDCDDSNVQVSPAETEVPYDGVDNDCNPQTRDDDVDGDGFVQADDCNDADPLAWPGAVEVPYDGSDNDCDSATPDDDLDRDGYPLATDCDDGNVAVHPGAGEVIYDGLDNDCNGATPDDDLDGDGYTLVDDCDDTNAAINPVAAEVAYDGVDNDCRNGDECDIDNDGLDATAPLCGGTDCDDNNFAIGCTTYYSDLDGDGWGVGGQCICGPTGVHTALLPGDCYDFNASAHPGQSQFFASDRGDGSYDYNCANGEEKQDTRTDSWDCDVDYVPILDVIIDIDFDAGFIGGPPACGQNGTWSTNYNVTTTGFDADCDPVGGTNVLQRCR
jgi:hypothetical protein